MIKIAYNSTSDQPKLKRQNNHTTILLIHHPKGEMISCFINHLVSVANFQGHITNNELLDAMFAAPILIGIYVKIIIRYCNHSIYRFARCKR